jgi:hypothetical protein
VPGVDEDPSALVTTTAAGPAVPGGVSTVQAVRLHPFSELSCAACPPTATVAPARFVPNIAMLVPPAVLPRSGSMLVIAGAGALT